MIVAMFVPFGVFAMITISVTLVCRLIATASLNKTIREALRSDPGSVPVLAARLEARQPWADSLLGWIFLAFAVALVGIGLFERGDDQRAIFQAAVVPVVVGITVLLYCWVARPKT
ncbi:MAG: hypothetical protein QOG13_2382 [Sphingomonadales bacterium]|nr:hypothetical protein [Sphingomonadales bacterium]